MFLFSTAGWKILKSHVGILNMCGTTSPSTTCVLTFREKRHGQRHDSRSRSRTTNTSSSLPNYCLKRDKTCSANRTSTKTLPRLPFFSFIITQLVAVTQKLHLAALMSFRLCFSSTENLRFFRKPIAHNTWEVRWSIVQVHACVSRKLGLMSWYKSQRVGCKTCSLPSPVDFSKSLIERLMVPDLWLLRVDSNPTQGSPVRKLHTRTRHGSLSRSKSAKVNLNENLAWPTLHSSLTIIPKDLFKWCYVFDAFLFFAQTPILTQGNWSKNGTSRTPWLFSAGLDQREYQWTGTMPFLLIHNICANVPKCAV